MRASSGEDFGEIGVVVKAGRDAMASVFSPVRDSVFVAGSKSAIDDQAAQIERYAAIRRR